MDQQVRSWRPRVPGVREVFHARFREHIYPAHVHDVWTLIIVLRGDIRFALDGRMHGAHPSVVTLLPPGVAHDGRAGMAGSFTKLVLYLDATYLPDGLIGHAVDRPTIVDKRLRAGLLRVHTGLIGAADPLAVESTLVPAVERLSGRLRRGPTPAVRPDGDLAERARARLDARFSAPVTLAEVAQELGVSPGHLIRTFSGAFSISPYAYVVGRRVERARSLLLEEWPPSAAALEAGFYDQAHLTRHFVRHVGVTPARFASGSAPVPALTANS